MNCARCPYIGCLTCTSSSCLTCIGSTGQASSRLMPNCVCPALGYYNNAPAQDECQPCVNTRCNTCVNGTACNTCVGIQNAPATRVFPLCECPEGYYNYAPQQDCLKCNDACLTCQNLPSQCIICKRRPEYNSINNSKFY